MNEHSRIFDFLTFQQEKFPKPDMLGGKIAGEWRKYSTSEVNETVKKLAAGLLKSGVSGNDMQIENQDKIALISKTARNG